MKSKAFHRSTDIPVRSEVPPALVLILFLVCFVLFCRYPSARLGVMALPHYYSSLRPFRESFRTGQPVLTYHHVGRRTRGSRLKGLYVSGKLFTRQMAELQTAGF